MEIEEFVASVDNFAHWSHADKMKLFAWFLHSHQDQASFTSTDIGNCYKKLALAPPSAISPFINAMVKRSPPEVLRIGNGFVLERVVRQDLDAKYGRRPATVHVHKLLVELPSRIPNLAEKTYLEEALICFRHKAFRAAVVMCWNVTFDHLCEFVLSKHLADFNAQLPKTYPRADISVVTRRDDFSELKESQVLQVCKSGRIISDGMSKILFEKLGRRNMAAHPSGVAINETTAEEIIRELIENVVLKLT